MPDEIKPTEVPNAAQTPPLPLPHGGILAPQGGGGILAGAAPRIPIRGAAFDGGQDVTKKLGDDAGAFGNVLTSIGGAVAVSQKALDKSVVDTIKKLNDKKIKVVTAVRQELTDDGVPDASKTTLVTNELSVLNFFTPEFHEFKEVSVSMDLSVGAFHSEQGVQFKNTQESHSLGGSYSWGFGGWFNYQGSSAQQSGDRNRRQDGAWSSGEVLMDAQLAPRRTGKFPVPARVDIGPQIYITQGAVTDKKTDDKITGRNVQVTIEVRKRDGSPMDPGKEIVVDAGNLLISFAPGTSHTDNAGRVMLTLTRSLSAATTGFQKFPVTIGFGAMHKTLNVML